MAWKRSPRMCSRCAPELRHGTSRRIVCTPLDACGRPIPEQAEPSQRDAHLGPIWAQRLWYVSTYSLIADTRYSESTAHELARSLIRRSGGQGVASSNLASPTKTIHSIRPSRSSIQPTFLPPSITPSDFVSGTWWGNESDRLNEQIRQLDGWVASRDEPAGVKTWARKVIENLKRRRDVVLEEEAEERR
jgi:hypothetical protein